MLLATFLHAAVLIAVTLLTAILVSVILPEELQAYCRRPAGSRHFGAA